MFGLGFHWFITNSDNLTAAGLPGPLAHHDGNYLYACGTDGIEGETTTLLSPILYSRDQGEGFCVSFFYSLFVRTPADVSVTTLKGSSQVYIIGSVIAIEIL